MQDKWSGTVIEAFLLTLQIFFGAAVWAGVTMIGTLFVPH